LARWCSSRDNYLQQSGPEKAGPLLLILSVTVMPMQMSAVQLTTSPDERHTPDTRHGAGAPATMTPLAVRVQGEYREMPGLRLTVRQAARLFSVAPDVADTVLTELRRASVLACSDDGVFALISEPSRRRTPGRPGSEATPGLWQEPG
jgi:hypothetical protein